MRWSRILWLHATLLVQGRTRRTLNQRLNLQDTYLLTNLVYVQLIALVDSMQPWSDFCPDHNNEHVYSPNKAVRQTEGQIIYTIEQHNKSTAIKRWHSSQRPSKHFCRQCIYIEIRLTTVILFSLFIYLFIYCYYYLLLCIEQSRQTCDMILQ